MQQSLPAALTYREKVSLRIAERRRLREEEELREEEKIPWFNDIKHLIRPDIKADKIMPNYTSKPIGQKVWFDLVGHSMTCIDQSISIPQGSRVLARRLPSNVQDIPLNRSLIIIWKESGEVKCFCKTVSDVWCQSIHCVSLNSDPYYEPFNVWMNDIIEIFEVVKVVRPVAD